MARALRIEYEGAFYHVISRGNEGRDIFKDEADRVKFLDYLKDQVIRYHIKIHAYCLMNNHYHLIIETPQANLTKAMQPFNASYTIYFNHRYRRFGHLFQGRYKAILIQADEYLHHLSRYIHLNPVRLNLVQDPKDYPYSSYRYFISNNKPPEYLTTEFILSMFAKTQSKAKVLYKKFVQEAIGNETDIIRKNILSGFILAKPDFVSWVRENFLKDKVDKEIPVLKELKKKKMSIERIIQQTEAAIKDKKLCRKISIYLTRKYTDKKLLEIAQYYGRISDAGVSGLYHRVEEQRKKNKKLGLLISRMEKLLKIEI